VVTLPVGYGDGYMRCMSGQAEVVIRGHRYPVVGRICMDQVMVNLGWDSAFNGDEVVLLGGKAKRPSASRRWPRGRAQYQSRHEILTSINTRVPRVIQQPPSRDCPSSCRGFMGRLCRRAK
jgi:alanine racemase